MTDGIELPDTFLWGAATSAHQVEGQNTSSDWWDLEHRADSPCVDRSGDAADSYHRYSEDIGLLSAAGLNAYRFSLEWSRIEPEPGEISRAQLEHYRRMIENCRNHEVAPIVTLQHFTLPFWLAREGGWLSPRAVERFRRYVDACLPILGDVEWVVTINEPNLVAMVGGDGQAAVEPSPGIPLPNPRAAEHLLAAHRNAVRQIRSLNGARAGWSIANQVFEALPGYEAERDAYAYPREDVFIEASRGDDFLGVQAYLRTLIGADGPVVWPDDVERTLMGWEYHPQALGKALRYAHRISGGVPLLVTENGIATGDDRRRIDYTAAALVGLAEAMSAGVDVRGYLHWSLLDNFEWKMGFAPTFGLVHVDRHTFERTPKPSLTWLGDVARANRLPVEGDHTVDAQASARKKVSQ